MQAISTKYHGPTNTRGARISAQAQSGKVSISYPYELDAIEAHRKAAQALCDKFEWKGQFVSGWDHRDGYVHVFVS